MPWKKFVVFVASIVLLFAIFFTATYAQDRDKKTKSGDDRGGNIVIAQISDTHIGLARAPEASENLRKIVEMVNQRNPDAVIVTGDIGEREDAWDEAKKIFSGLKPKVFYIPGNHDVTANKPQSLGKWRADFGNDYYEAHIKGVTIIALDGQLMGNYDNFNQKKASPLSQDAQQESERMLGWLFAPFVWLLGVPWSQAGTAGGLMGIKIILTELVAYLRLAALPAGALDPRSTQIMVYAMCGFANFASVGILIAGMSALIPERRDEVVSLALKALVAGTLASGLSGAMIGLLPF